MLTEAEHPTGVKLFDLLGNEHQVPKARGADGIELSVDVLPEGVYMVQVEDRKRVLIRKVVISR